MSPTPPSVAVCHDWTLARFGSEQVAARLAKTLDARDVYTFAAAPDVIRTLFPGRRVHTSRVGRTAFAQRHWPWLLPLMGRWWRGLDLSSHDVVVTSSHASVNSICARPGAVHISYCYTPMRYAWMWRDELRRFPRPIRLVWPMLAAVLRRGDRRRAKNVDFFIAISKEVASRIERFYGRDSVVVYPPVDTTFYTPDDSVPREDFFLYAGRLVAYKRPDIVVRAARLAGVRLIVAGSGAELSRLRALSGPEAEFREEPSNDDLRELYRRARALVFPGVEDFGMALVEAQACGTPVIAQAAGGALETVIDGQTGVLYSGDSAEVLADAFRGFTEPQYDTAVVRRNAERFTQACFDEAIQRVVRDMTGRHVQADQ